MSLYFDLWGYRALKLGKDRSRWAAVKDARSGIVLPSPDLGEIARTSSRLATYRREATDHWSPPSETVNRGYGDCEDFAILNRSLFIEAGGTDEASAMIIVRDLMSSRPGRSAYHAVAVFAVGAETMMIDTEKEGVVPAKSAIDYVPIVAYCGESLYLYGTPVKGGADA